MAQKLICWIFDRLGSHFRYFWGPPMGPKGVRGGGTPSDSSQGVYERLLKKHLDSKDP